MSFRATRTLSLGRIERYVLIQQARALTVALAVIASLIMLIDFVEISRGVGSDVDLSALRIVGLMGMKSPAVILQLMPFVFLFGTLAAYVGLNRRSELIAMRAAGLSAWRFVLPAAGTALIFGVLTITVLGPVAAWGDGLFQRERARLSSAPVETDQPKAVWIREGDSQRQMIIRAARQISATAQLQDVTVFIYTVGEGGALSFVERIDAASAALTSGSWRLTDAVGAQTGQRAVSYARLDLPSSLARDEAFARFARPQSTSLWALPTQIRRVEQAGFSSSAYRFRLH